MMTSRTDERDHRLSRVEHDVAAIYELLTDVHQVQSAHGAELAAMRAKFDEQSTVLTSHTTVLAEHSTVLAEHSTVLAEHSAALARHDKDLASIKSTVTRIDTAVVEILRRLPEAS